MSKDDFRELVNDIDSYIEGLFAPFDEALERTPRRSEEAGFYLHDHPLDELYSVILP